MIVRFILDQGMKGRFKMEHWDLCFSVYLPYTGVKEVCGVERHKLQYATCYQINDIYGGLSKILSC